MTNYRSCSLSLILVVVLISEALVFNASELFAYANHEDQVTTTPTSLSNQQIYPRTFFLDPSLLVNVKKIVNNGNNSILQEALTKLLFEADHFLTKKPSSVMDKTQLPPSGNKHDFLSQNPYRWKNPDTPNGLPYIFRDGKTNPDADSIPDKRAMDDMVDTVKILSLAYYFTDNNRYASKATELLRVWFLDNATRMNPNLDYSETIPGRDKLHSSGIIAGWPLVDIIDSIGMIQNSLSWTKKDQHEIELWFSNYLDWILNSDVGKEESRKINNHGTYYDVQASSFALFLNKTDVTEGILDSITHELTPATLVSTPKAIEVKIQPDGRQPFELARPKSLAYSIFNLLGLFKLASIGQHVGIDLWNYKTPEGAGLQKALDYLLPYVIKNKSWPYEQIKGISRNDTANLLCQASIHYQNNRAYIEAYNSINRTDTPLNVENYVTCVYLNMVKPTERRDSDIGNSLPG